MFTLLLVDGSFVFIVAHVWFGLIYGVCCLWVLLLAVVYYLCFGLGAFTVV